MSIYSKFYLPTVYNIGFLGEGNYKPSLNGKRNKEYSLWQSMLQRCYDEKFNNRHIAYKDCIVDDEWLNFQNFAEWFYSNYNPEYMEGWQLDKDLLCKNNKKYGKHACCFLPQRLNKLLTKNDRVRGGYPIGVDYYKSKNKFRATISIDNRQRHIGYFKTSEEAFEAYKVEKEKEIKRLANNYKKELTKEVYKALCNYKVEIND